MHEAPSHGGHHVVPVRVYLAIFAALMVFTAITVAVAFVDLGPLNNLVMIGIAITKATLVVLFFMHVKYNTRLVHVTVVGGFVWLLILFAFVLQDYLTRGWLGVGTTWN